MNCVQTSLTVTFSRLAVPVPLPLPLHVHVSACYASLLHTSSMRIVNVLLQPSSKYIAFALSVQMPMGLQI